MSKRMANTLPDITKEINLTLKTVCIRLNYYIIEIHTNVYI